MNVSGMFSFIYNFLTVRDNAMRIYRQSSDKWQDFLWNSETVQMFVSKVIRKAHILFMAPHTYFLCLGISVFMHIAQEKILPKGSIGKLQERRMKAYTYVVMCPVHTACVLNGRYQCTCSAKEVQVTETNTELTDQAFRTLSTILWSCRAVSSDRGTRTEKMG